MPTTLSPRQLEVLRRLAEPGARAMFLTIRAEGFWLLDDKTVSRQIWALIKAGLVEATRTDYDRRGTATINDAGRAVVGGKK